MHGDGGTNEIIIHVLTALASDGVASGASRSHWEFVISNGSGIKTIKSLNSYTYGRHGIFNMNEMARMIYWLNDQYNCDIAVFSASISPASSSRRPPVHQI